LLLLVVAALVVTSCPAGQQDVKIRDIPAAGSDYSFALLSAPVPDVLVASSRVKIPVRLVNSGRRDWLGATGCEYYLSYHWRHPGGRSLGEMYWGLRTPLPTPVGAGQIIQLEMDLAAPGRPKFYDLAIDIVKIPAGGNTDGAVWLGEQPSGTFRVEVTGR